MQSCLLQKITSQIADTADVTLVIYNVVAIKIRFFETAHDLKE